MRKEMVRVVSEEIETNEKSVLILIDIGVWAFRSLLEKYRDRAKNIGIFESGTISIAAGMSIAGMVPTIYGINPFIVQRSLEQLKLDFIYQNTGGNFITTGSSYDFSTLGYSHYCPEDIAILRLLPGMEIVTPATPKQFKYFYKTLCNNNKPTFFRMTDYSVETDIKVEFGIANVIKIGRLATVVCVSETLDIVIQACLEIDVTIIYYTTLAPFDYKTLKNYCTNNRVLLCEPFYRGTLYYDVIEALKPVPISIESIGVPLEVLRNYGTKREKDEYCGITISNIRHKLLTMIENNTLIS